MCFWGIDYLAIYGFFAELQWFVICGELGNKDLLEGCLL
jgi:hypothetical protein